MRAAMQWQSAKAEPRLINGDQSIKNWMYNDNDDDDDDDDDDGPRWPPVNFANKSLWGSLRLAPIMGNSFSRGVPLQL